MLPLEMHGLSTVRKGATCNKLIDCPAVPRHHAALVGTHTTQTKGFPMSTPEQIKRNLFAAENAIAQQHRNRSFPPGRGGQKNPLNCF